MTSVLVVEDDAPFRSAVARDLRARGFEVHAAEGLDEAIGLLGTASVDVLLTDLRLGDRDGIDLLRAACATSARTRAILMSAFATARDYQIAVQLGAVQVLCKPFTPRELMAAIQQAIECETGFRGSVHGLSLVDMLQMFNHGRRSITVHVDGTTSGSIHVREGEIVHAEMGRQAGTAALRALLATPSGAVRTSALEAVERTIDQPFFALVLDSLRQVDEQRADAPCVDARDDEAAAVSSEAPRRAADDWQGVRTLLPQVAPDAMALVLDLDTGEVEWLHADPCDATALLEPARALAESASRLGTWTQLEHVGDGVAFALFRERTGRRLFVIAEALRGRYAALRFRSEVGRLLAWITAAMEGGGDGKDR